MIMNNAIHQARKIRDYLALPSAAKKEYWHDRIHGLGHDAGIKRTVTATIDWLCRAQDCSVTRDGGIARNYSLLTGWESSYPETTGYAIPTIIDYAEQHHDAILMERAKRMLDWIVKIQFPEGGFQGGVINNTPIVPVTFNTGQILIGLSCGAAKFGGQYLHAAQKAAHWLVQSQDPDGCWRKYPSPFAGPGEKAYEAHSAWGLFEASRVCAEQKYADAAKKCVLWALTKQQKNGWFSDCCLSEPLQPLTHTIGYVLRGVLEAYRYTKDPIFLKASTLTADGLLTAMTPTGFLPGRLNSNWQGTVPSACLAGSEQIAYSLLLLYQETRDTRYRDSAFAVNQYVRRTVRLKSSLETRGAIKGSFPIWGNYEKYEYLNWAAKFFIDSNLFEQKIRNSEL